MVCDEGSFKSFNSNMNIKTVTTFGTAITDNTLSKKDLSSPSVPCELRIISNKPQDLKLTRKRKYISAPVSSSSSRATWKIVSKSIYYRLCDLYHSTIQIKIEEEPKKEPKKREKYNWSKETIQKQPLSFQKNVAIKTHLDPYIECLKEVGTQSSSTIPGHSGSKFGIVMYLGVERPLFPLVYRNLRMLNNSNDTTITDFWAEFSLSTLITKTDEKCKLIVVPVKDSELTTIAAECVEEAVTSDESNGLDAVSATDVDTISQIFIKQEENDVPEKKCKYELRSQYTKLETFKSYKLHTNSYKKFTEKEPEKISNPTPTTYIRSRNLVEKESEKVSDIKSTTSTHSCKLTEKKSEKISEIKPAIYTRSRKFTEKESEKILYITPRTSTRSCKFAEKDSVKISDTKPTHIRSRTPDSKPSVITISIHPTLTPPQDPTPTFAPATTLFPISTPTSALTSTPTSIRSSTPITVSPKSKPKSGNRVIRTKKPVLHEKNTLKKCGYEKCLVTVPKPSDTLVKHLNAENCSNESAELNNPTEREVIEETDDFGLIQCTRTDGIIIDYVKRNRSLVYFYKLKKMLDFQKTNNKYFVCCDYMLINRSDTGEEDENIDIFSIPIKEDYNCNEFNRIMSTESRGSRNSRNPNDLFKTSKISEWKNKLNRISWVKNRNLKFVSDVKWLLIAFDKHIAFLRHANGCVLRHRLLFEIIYRADLSKKVICCEISSQSAISTSYNDSNNGTDTDATSDKLAFGVYAFPGLCDKVLVGPYLFHQDHQFSAGIRMNNGNFEHADIRTLEEKENFLQPDDSTPVKHIIAKWWSGKKTADLTEQYLNFFFNPSAMKRTQLTDKLCLTKIIDEHPCHNYHSYEIKSRENNLVLFHDRTNQIERTVVTSTEPSTIIETDSKSNQTSQVATPSIPPKLSRNLRKKPRRDYSRLITDDMAIPAKTKNFEFHVVDIECQQRRQDAHGERQIKLKRNRYHESPPTHIMNERMRRLEFRNCRNDLVSILETRSSSGSSRNSRSLISILNQTKEIVASLEVDNNKFDEEGKRLRLEQSIMMRKFLALLRGFDINSAAYKKGKAFVASWKQIKAEHRNRLISILGQNFNEQKAKKMVESSRNDQKNIKEPTSVLQPAPSGENERDSLCSREVAMLRLKFRKQNRQKMRNALKKRNHSVEIGVTDLVECEISADMVCENGKLSDPFGSNYILDRMAQVPFNAPNMSSGIDSYLADPLANDDSDDDLPPPSKWIGGYSNSKKEEPPHPLYLEHSYCSYEHEPAKSSNVFDKLMPQFKNIYLQKTESHPIRSFGNSYRAPVLSAMMPPYVCCPNRPSQRRTDTRTQMPAAVASPSPFFQMKVSKSAKENLAIDLLDNGKLFARLNIAKINNGCNANNAASSFCGAAEASTSSEIITIIQQCLLQIGKTSPSNIDKDDERIKQAKRKYVVNSLKSFISKFESRRQRAEDANCSSSHPSNSDNVSPPNVTDCIELESGYSSKSEESYDRDLELDAYESALRNCLTNDQAIESIILDDEDVSEIELQESMQVQRLRCEQEPIEVHILERAEQQQQELIEIEEEEKFVDGSNTLKEMNGVDTVMRDSKFDCFAESDDSTEKAMPLVSDDCANVMLHLESYRLSSKEERLTLPKSMPKVSYRTNQFSIFRSKNKFVPNIMKTSTKTVFGETSASEHLSRIQIKPSGGWVKLSTASMQHETNSVCNTTSFDSNDSIIQRLWYSPVSRSNQADQKALQQSALDDSVKISGLQSERLADWNEEIGPNTEKDHSSGNRILIKSFASYDKFKEAFVFNVDKLLKSEVVEGNDFLCQNPLGK